MEATYLFYALAIAFLMIFWRIGKQIMATYRCLDERELRDFISGRSRKREAQHRRIISHLGHCEKCQKKLHRLQNGLPTEDHLVE